MIRTDDGYGIMEDTQANKLVIFLPQTPETATNTIGEVNFTRKKELKAEELSAVLSMVRFVYEGGKRC